MSLEFTINESSFLALFGLYFVFFGVVWSISYAIKYIRQY